MVVVSGNQIGLAICLLRYLLKKSDALRFGKTRVNFEISFPCVVYKCSATVSRNGFIFFVIVDKSKLLAL